MQSKLESAIEATCNTLSGFIVSLLVQVYVIVPMFDLQTTVTQDFAMTLIFTVISIIRSYVWRRIFNWRAHRKLKLAH